MLISSSEAQSEHSSGTLKLSTGFLKMIRFFICDFGLELGRRAIIPIYVQLIAEDRLKLISNFSAELAIHSASASEHRKID